MGADNMVSVMAKELQMASAWGPYRERFVINRTSIIYSRYMARLVCFVRNQKGTKKGLKRTKCGLK